MSQCTCPFPNFLGRLPHNWQFFPQVDVKEFRPDDAMNTFKMSGPHRFAVTGEDIRLFALGRSTALVLRIDTVRQLTVPTNRSFR